MLDQLTESVPSELFASIPLLDQKQVNEWQSDLEADEVAAALSIVPDEVHLCLANIESAAHDGNPAAARRHAHALKGLAVNLGAARLGAAARQVELADDSAAAFLTCASELRNTALATLRAFGLPES